MSAHPTGTPQHEPAPNTRGHGAAGSTPARSSQLAQLLDALKLQASPQQREQLLAYLDLLQRWNRVYNLTAVREPQHMLTRHLADCLALLPALATQSPRRLLDVGSGGGLPGLVLAIMRPDMHVTLNDAVQKKCAFMQQAAAELRLQNVDVEHGRVEQLACPAFDCITSRAFSDLATLVKLTAPLLAENGRWAAMKGIPPQEELAALPADLETHVQVLSVPGLQAQRCVVWMLRRSIATQHRDSR